MFKTCSTLLRICAALMFMAGCGPDYPNDENHQNVGNDDCIDCHVDRAHPDAPNVPGKHLDNGSIKSKYKDCKDCHEQAD